MDIDLRDQLLMENGTVLRVRRTVVGAAPFDKLVETLANMTSKDYKTTPVLPGVNGACRMYIENNTFIGFLMQCSPCVWSIRFNARRERPIEPTRTDPNDPDTFLYDLSIPWLWVLCRFWRADGLFQWNECYMVATYSNIERMSDKVYYSPIPNIWPNSSKMCTDELTKYDTKPIDEPALMCRKFLYKLPQCYFNDDLTGEPAFSVRKNHWPETLSAWEKKTLDNPACALDEHFGLVEYGTLEKFVERSMRDGT